MEMAAGTSHGPGGYFSAREPSKKKTATCCICGKPISGEHACYWGHFEGDHFNFHAHVDCANETYPWTLKPEDVKTIRDGLRAPALFEM